MTPSDIDAMEAGPEMDAVVAERLMRRSGPFCSARGFPQMHSPLDCATPHLPPYSTDDAAALEVFKAIAAADQIDVSLRRDPVTLREHFFRCFVFRHDEIVSDAWAPTLALAICRAALKATASSEPIVGTATPAEPVVADLVQVVHVESSARWGRKRICEERKRKIFCYGNHPDDPEKGNCAYCGEPMQPETPPA